jgi:hypothetical protein
MKEAEVVIKSLSLPDIDFVVKMQNFIDVTGYAGFISGDESDRRKLYIKDVHPMKRKKDGQQFGYGVITKSIGSGKEARFTIFNKLYETLPVQKGSVILCKSYTTENGYYTLRDYEVLS